MPDAKLRMTFNRVAVLYNSDHISVRHDQKRALFRDIVALISSTYHGIVTKEYETVLELRRKKD